jgi:tRNA(fMet)-specific endonuclease VapC
MPYLLDTNICIYIIKRKPESILAKLGSILPGEIGISMITVAELKYGASKSENPEKNFSALEKFLIPINLFDFGYSASKEYGIIRSELEKVGLPIGPLDTLIAAHAISLNHILVTNNEREFRRVARLKVENWI